jgi:hypothetical protein
MCAICVCHAISFIKWWCFHKNSWNFLWLFWTLCWWFWYVVCNFWIPGWGDMNFWLEVWQFVSHHTLWTSWFYLICLGTLDWAKFLHDWAYGCWKYMWIFLDLLMAFPIWLEFFPLFGHLLIFCDTCWYLLCEILVINWMSVKFGMSIVDTL